MVMVEIDSNVILVEPIKNRKYEELTRTHRAIMLRLLQAGMIPRKHILDNEVSGALKSIIQYEYKMKLELVPPCTHHRNAAEVAIPNFKAHPQYTGRHRTRFSAIIVGQAPTTGRNNNKPLAAVQCNSQRFGIRPSERPV